MKKAKNLGNVTHVGTLKNSKGITLIALTITIIVVLVIAVIAINIATGNNGLISRANEAKVLYKNALYYEEIDMAIIEEQMDRFVHVNENEPFIQSIYYRLWGKEQASNLSIASEYTRRPWIASQPQMLDNNYTPNPNIVKDIYLLLETVDGYEIWVQFDNDNNTAEVLKDRTNKINTEKYTVSFNPGEGTGTIESLEVRANCGIKLPTGEGFTRQGYTLTGWKDEDNNEYDKETTYIVTKDVTLTAQWSENVVYISYLPGFTLPAEQSEKEPVAVSKDTQTTVLESQYTRLGYSFNGWLCTEDNKVYNIEDNENSKILANSNKTLTAQWTAVEYSLTYELNGGELETGVTNPSTYTIETSTITLNNPTKAGNTFSGWSGTGLNGDANTTVTIEKGSMGNRNYTANWSPAKYTLQLYGSGSCSGTNINTCGKCDVYINGTKVGNQVTTWSGQYDYGTTYEFKNVTSNSGYDFQEASSTNIKGTITGNTNAYIDFGSLSGKGTYWNYGSFTYSTKGTYTFNIGFKPDLIMVVRKSDSAGWVYDGTYSTPQFRFKGNFYSFPYTKTDIAHFETIGDTQTTFYAMVSSDYEWYAVKVSGKDLPGSGYNRYWNYGTSYDSGSFSLNGKRPDALSLTHGSSRIMHSYSKSLNESKYCCGINDRNNFNNFASASDTNCVLKIDSNNYIYMNRGSYDTNWHYFYMVKN